MTARLDENTATNANGPSGWDPYLDPGERLLWEGAPVPGLRFRATDLFQTLFGLMFFGFAVFWILMAGSFTGPNDGPFMFFPLFGLPFVAVGGYFAFGRLFWEAHVRAKTRYALTTRRAIVAKSAWGRSMESHRLTSDDHLVFMPGETATIWFKETTTGRGKNRRTQKHGFEYITDGDRIFRLMREVARGDHDGASGNGAE